MVGGENPNIAAMRWPPGMGSWGLQWPCRPAGLWWATPSGDLPRLCWLFPYLPMNYLLNNQEEILSAPDGQDTRVCSFFFPGRELLGQGCWSQEGNLTLAIKEAIIPRRLPECRMQRIL